jgi:hypothetical protein
MQAYLLVLAGFPRPKIRPYGLPGSGHQQACTETHAMNDHSPFTRRLSRRGILRGAAGGISALALQHAMLGGSAFAAPKKKPTAKQLADVKAKRVKAVDATASDTKLSAQQEKLAKLMLQKSKRSMALAAANPKAKFQKGSIHAVAAGIVVKQKRKRSDRAKQRAAKLLSDPAATQQLNFGKYAKATLASATVKQAPDVDITAAVRELIDAEKKKQPTPKMMGDSDKYQTIEFHLNSVECIEETSGALEGSDEIVLGGQLVTPTGKIKNIAEFRTKDEFDEGQSKFYDWEVCDILTAGGTIDVPSFASDACPHGSADNVYRGFTLASANLAKGTYTLVLLMGELDDGGFADILEDVYGALEDEVNAAIEAAGGAVGAAFGSIIPGLGTAIGAVLGWIAAKIIEWFLDLFDNDDDLVASKSWQVSFDKKTVDYVKSITPNHLPTPNGTRASEMKKLTYTGDGGQYEVRLHWRVSL